MRRMQKECERSERNEAVRRRGEKNRITERSYVASGEVKVASPQQNSTKISVRRALEQNTCIR